MSVASGATTQSTTATASEATRWGQLIFGIICMTMIANLQYGWTLFVGPIDQKYHWGRAAIQVAFTIFVLTETWLVPIEGYLIDKFGPRIMISRLGRAGRDRVGHQLVRRLALPALPRRRHRRHRRGRDLRRLGRQRAEMVSGPAWTCGRSDRGGLRRRLRAHRHPDRQHDRVERISNPRSSGSALGKASSWSSSGCSCALRRLAKSPRPRRLPCSRRGATTPRPKRSRRRCSG